MSKPPTTSKPLDRLTDGRLLGRRDALGMALSAVPLGLALAAGASRSANSTAFDVVEVAPGIFVHPGVHELSTPDNLGAIANVGFIVGEAAVAVIDTGGCALAGGRLHAAIQEVTDRPVRYVVASHVHPDHLMGHAAFAAEQPTFVGHAKLAAALAARGPFYLEKLREAFGPLAEGTELVAPTLLVEERLVLDLGGRKLELIAHPTAHTNNDLSVLDSATGTLWLADLLFMARCPVIDGSLLGWLAVLEQLRNREFARVVPGHGPVSALWPAALDPQLAYLTRLRDEIRAVLAAGGTLEQAVATVGQEERSKWLLFDEYHARNVTAAFAELEWE
jgi:quinoprotein relay system zinc metallohydrolase 2